MFRRVMNHLCLFPAVKTQPNKMQRLKVKNILAHQNMSGLSCGLFSMSAGSRGFRGSISNPSYYRLIPEYLSFIKTISDRCYVQNAML